ncbi:MAG: leucine-rich repeat protein [Saccharofermentans sp.]|nr:leucine-rich repeat protein [Saccharofermentans sp.]
MSVLSVTLSVVLTLSTLLTCIPGPVKAETDTALEAADFTSYNYMTVDGNPIEVGVSGSSFYVHSEVIENLTVTLFDAEASQSVKTFNEEAADIEVDLEGYMDEDALYFVGITYTYKETKFYVYNNYVIWDGGEVKFYKSPNYDFNVQRCSELRTDEQSLNEMLEPQNDIECDDPVLVSYSDQICEGSTSDWEKVFRIYYYIISQMAYDSVQVEDDTMTYQDGAVCLMRRGIAICEGFGNVFTALCRAQGIPATVQFGIGLVDYDEMMDEELPTNEDCDHAWAAVCIEGTWYYMDPTFDIGSYYEGDSWDSGTYTEYEPSFSYYLLPLEAFSYDHKICDADTVHGLEASGSCGDNATYTITRDGTLTISGSGTVVLPYGCNNFNKVVFAPDSNIDRIGEGCFVDCDLITSVILPETVTVIEAEAFNTCEDLEYVYLPSGLESIGREAFDYCDELSYIYIPDSCTYIGKWAFDDCSQLYISVPSSISDLDSEYYISPMHIEYR